MFITAPNEILLQYACYIICLLASYGFKIQCFLFQYVALSTKTIEVSLLIYFVSYFVNKTTHLEMIYVYGVGVINFEEL